jgi:CO dehydrogenase maturation factor
MRVAIAGKGGSGKTTIAATLARLAGRSGATVVALDADSNPNLAAALGLPHERVVGALPAGLVSRKPDGPALTRPLDEVLDDTTADGPDGVRLAIMGMPAHAGEGCLCGAHATVSAVLADLGSRPGTTTIVDLEATPEHLSRGTARNVDVLLLVTEPYYRSLETARRLAHLAAELPIPRIAAVANKVRSEEERDVVAEFCARHGIELAAAVPWSDAAIEADLSGLALLDHAPDDPVVEGIGALAAALADAPVA